MVLKHFFSLFAALLTTYTIAHAQPLTFMGLPLCQDISQYNEVLKNKGYHDEFPTGKYAHTLWTGGDFWKVSGCYLHLFTSAPKDDSNMRNKVTSIKINLPLPNFNHDFNSYKSMLKELVRDYAEKYGINFEIEKRYNSKTKKEDLNAIIWKVPDGEIEMIVNWNAIWVVDITYSSAYILHMRNEATKFKGSGKDDL